MAKAMSAKQGYMKRNRKRDANEQDIIDELGKFPGVTVYQLDKPLDLLVGYMNITDLIEVKNPDGANRIEKDQKEFLEEWEGREPIIVRTREDVQKWWRDINAELNVDPGGLSGVRFPRSG